MIVYFITAAHINNEIVMNFLYFVDICRFILAYSRNIVKEEM